MIPKAEKSKNVNPMHLPAEVGDQKLKSYILLPNPALIIGTGAALDRGDDASMLRSLENLGV